MSHWFSITHLYCDCGEDDCPRGTTIRKRCWPPRPESRDERVTCIKASHSFITELAGIRGPRTPHTSADVAAVSLGNGQIIYDCKPDDLHTVMAAHTYAEAQAAGQRTGP